MKIECCPACYWLSRRRYIINETQERLFGLMLVYCAAMMIIPTTGVAFHLGRWIDLAVLTWTLATPTLVLAAAIVDRRSWDAQGRIRTTVGMVRSEQIIVSRAAKDIDARDVGRLAEPHDRLAGRIRRRIRPLGVAAVQGDGGRASEQVRQLAGLATQLQAA